MVILLAQITQIQKTRLKVDFYTVVLAFCYSFMEKKKGRISWAGVQLSAMFAKI